MAESNARNRSAWTQAVAAQIRAERAASGMTQRQVMEASGIPKSTYLRMESGERVPDADQLATFAAALGIRLSVFFQRVEERAADQPTPGQVVEAALSDMSPEAQAAIRDARRHLGHDPEPEADPGRAANG